MIKNIIVFIDEIDTIGKKRDGHGVGGNDEREQTLNALLTEMNGFTDGEGIIVLAATNRPEMLHAALMREGRFDRRIEISLPDREERRRMLSVHTRNKPMAPDADLDALAKKTVFSSQYQNHAHGALCFAGSCHLRSRGSHRLGAL